MAIDLRPNIDCRDALHLLLRHIRILHLFNDLAGWHRCRFVLARCFAISRRVKMGIRGFTKALVVVGFSAFSSIASAAFIQTFAGNDCSGVFGQGFANCKIPANIDPNESPIIIKFNIGAARLRDQFRAVPDDRRQRIRLHRHRYPERDLDIHPRGGRSYDQFLCREGWTRLQPLQQPGRSTFRHLVHTGESGRPIR